MDIKRKIQKTFLFDPEEKIELLVNFDTFSTEQIQKLEQVIDGYDASTKQLVEEFKHHFLKTLDEEKVRLQYAGKVKELHALEKLQKNITPVLTI